jgi:hypothetical protein
LDDVFLVTPFWYQTNSRGASGMASIYKKPPHFVLEKTLDKKSKLPDTYKLQSNDSQNKITPKSTKTVENLALSLLQQNDPRVQKRGQED